MLTDVRAPRPRAAVTSPVPLPVTGQFRMLLSKFLNAASGSALGCDTYPPTRRLQPAANLEVSQ